MIITSEDVGDANIKRYLDRGYIKLIGTNALEEQKEIEHIVTETIEETEIENDELDEYLSPAEIDKLKKNELLQYAEHIGIENINANATNEELKSTINQFIEEVQRDDTEEED